MGLNIFKASKVHALATKTGLPLVAVGTSNGNNKTVQGITSDHRHVWIETATGEYEIDEEPVHWYNACAAIEAHPQLTPEALWDIWRLI